MSTASDSRMVAEAVGSVADAINGRAPDSFLLLKVLGEATQVLIAQTYLSLAQDREARGLNGDTFRYRAAALLEEVTHTVPADEAKGA